MRKKIEKFKPKLGKYIIENCPAHDYSIADWDCRGKDTIECSECSDCLLKRIYEEAKYWEKDWVNDPDERYGFEEILKLFKIREVEDENN